MSIFPKIAEHVPIKSQQHMTGNSSFWLFKPRFQTPILDGFDCPFVRWILSIATNRRTFANHFDKTRCDCQNSICPRIENGDHLRTTFMEINHNRTVEPRSILKIQIFQEIGNSYVYYLDNDDNIMNSIFHTFKQPDFRLVVGFVHLEFKRFKGLDNRNEKIPLVITCSVNQFLRFRGKNLYSKLSNRDLNISKPEKIFKNPLWSNMTNHIDIRFIFYIFNSNGALTGRITIDLPFLVSKRFFLISNLVEKFLVCSSCPTFVLRKNKLSSFRNLRRKNVVKNLIVVF